MNLLAIDPGIRGCGVAYFEDSKLFRAAYVKNSLKEGNGPRECEHMAREVLNWYYGIIEVTTPYTLVLEWPQVYVASKLKGDPNDLLALAGVDAAIASVCIYESLAYYLPHAWKGTVPKDIFAERAIARLSDEEKTKIEKCPKTLIHNTYDAIALGLFHFGRLSADRVIAR